jgi:DNA-binding transcriptional LysR family regulator
MDRLMSMRAFERVAFHGSFAAAARAMDVSAPVVTRLVADLEHHLNARLLQRTTRRVVLTDAGQSYLARVRSILQDIDEADSMVGAQTHALAGTLRLHAPPVLATYVIAPLLAEFRLRYPNIRIDLHVDSVREPPVDDYDITLLGTQQGFDARIVARKIVDASTILVAAPAYLKRRGIPANPQALQAHDCLRLRMPQGQTNEWRLWQPGREEAVLHVPIEPVLVANHTDTLLKAAMDGAGITSVSTDIVARHLQQGSLARVLEPWITGRLAMYAALPSRRFIPERTKVFLEHLVTGTREHARLRPRAP